MTHSVLSAKRETLEVYLDELYLWNQRMNLTTVPREDAWARHLEDSGSLLDLIESSVQRIADIGSGAGLPGLLCALAFPDATVGLVEADRRKAGFLMHVAGKLELDNVVVLPVRAEQLRDDPAWSGTCDVVTSRAAGAPVRVAGWSLPLLSPTGRVLLMAGDVAEVVDTLRSAGFHASPADASGVVQVIGD